MFTICGVYCEKECSDFNNGCPGCREIKGRVFWAKNYGTETCPIYYCAREKEIKDCGFCSRVPCRLWFSTRDPSISEDEFNQQIALRLKNLENRNED